MENNEDFYSKIVYKKNAFSDFAIDLKVYYRQKRVAFVSTKGVSSRFITEIVNALSIAGCEFYQFIAKHHFDMQELKILSDMFIEKQFDLIVVLGAGKAIDVAKYFASVFNLPYMVCPTAPTNISYFSKLCVNPYDSTRSFFAEEPERIYISEPCIKKAPKNLIKQGICFVLSFYEFMVSTIVDNILFDKNIDTSAVRKVLEKLQKNIDDILTGDDDSKLQLMDYMIELGFYFRQYNFFDLSCYNLYFILEKISSENGKQIGSGEAMLVCSKMLLESYRTLFVQKNIELLDLPNYEKMSKIIEKYGIFCKKINNFAYFDKICKNKQLLERLNNLKEEFFYQCKKNIKELEKDLNKLQNYNKFTSSDKINLAHCFSAISVLPFVSNNNYIVSLIGGIGALNCL